MGDQERIADILNVGGFFKDEIKKNVSENPNSFKSWEYHEITHFTNEELYYLADELREQFEQLADETEETEKGLIFFFK